MTPASPWRYPSIKPPRPFKGPPPVSGLADRPSTYRDPAPPVEVASPRPPCTPDPGARLVVLAGVLGFLLGYALAVMA